MIRSLSVSHFVFWPETHFRLRDPWQARSFWQCAKWTIPKKALSRALWGIRSFAHTIILFTCKQHLNKTCDISIPYIRLGTTGNSLFFLVFNLLPCTLHCFFQLAKILCRHFLRNGHFCSCFDSFECLWANLNCIFVLEGNTLQFAVFIEALRSDLADICSEYQSRGFFFFFVKFLWNLNFIKFL